MTCQNMTLSTGGGGNSTIVEYAGDGSVVNTWSISDKADGIGADPLNHRVIITLKLNGKTTSFVQHLQTSKGLVYLDASGSEPVPPLAQASGASTAAAGGAGGASVPAAVVVTKPSSDSDTLPIVLAIIAVILAIAAGALAMTRRGPAAS